MKEKIVQMAYTTHVSTYDLTIEVTHQPLVGLSAKRKWCVQRTYTLTVKISLFTSYSLTLTKNVQLKILTQLTQMLGIHPPHRQSSPTKLNEFTVMNTDITTNPECCTMENRGELISTGELQRAQTHIPFRSYEKYRHMLVLCIRGNRILFK